LEQIRYSCGIAKNPITILGAGVGLGYAPAGPAHSATDDLAYMRMINGIEIFSPATTAVVKDLVNYTVRNRKLMYVRLERSYDVNLDAHYTHFSLDPAQGVYPLVFNNTSGMCIVTSGYLLKKAMQLAETFSCNVYDVYQLKPVPSTLKDYLAKHNLVVSLEEQDVNCGGFSSMIGDVILSNNLPCRLLKFGLNNEYILENGTREELLESHGLSVKNITQQLECHLNQIY
jgi:transketolase